MQRTLSVFKAYSTAVHQLHDWGKQMFVCKTTAPQCKVYVCCHVTILNTVFSVLYYCNGMQIFFLFEQMHNLFIKVNVDIGLTHPTTLVDSYHSKGGLNVCLFWPTHHGCPRSLWMTPKEVFEFPPCLSTSHVGVFAKLTSFERS